MSTLLVVACFIFSLASIVYAYFSLKNGYIIMRMPDGERIRYDKDTQARGFYVSVGLFMCGPFFIAFIASLNAS